jgi:hypothetical protein
MTKLACLLFAWCTASLGQTASVQGSVTDPSDSAIPGVTIRITNVSTGVVTDLETNASGLYSAPLLQPGSYRIDAEKTGFAPATRTGVDLDVGQTARVDFTLKIGSVNETVKVFAAALTVDSETSTVGQVIHTKQILDLPLNGRNYLDLARLTTGVAPSFGSSTDAKGTFSAVGQHGLQTNILLDGADNNSRFSGGQLGYEAQAVTPSIDAVQEFKVVTNNNSAEYGFRMGGTVIVSTKSGTNALHGSAYEFLRNDKLDATNFFGVGQPKPAFRRNQFWGHRRRTRPPQPNIFLRQLRGHANPHGRNRHLDCADRSGTSGGFQRHRPEGPARSGQHASEFPRTVRSRPFSGKHDSCKPLRLRFRQGDLAVSATQPGGHHE